MTALPTQPPFTVWHSDGAVRIETPEGTITLTTEMAAQVAKQLLPPRRSFNWTQEAMERVRELYMAGHRAEDIAAILGASVNAVSNKISELGIANRNPANSRRLRAVSK
jgi:hypothetical protein